MRQKIVDPNNYIKSFRKNHSLTQEALAKALGVSYATVNRWENSQRKPSALALAKLSSLAETLAASSVQLSHQKLIEIINHYNASPEILSNTFPDGGIEKLWSRLERAASNQIEHGEAAISRYAIWANTVRDHISEAIHLIEMGKNAESIKLLISAAKSLSAFSEIQSYFDNILLKHQNEITK